MAHQALQDLQKIIEETFDIDYLFVKNQKTKIIVARSVFNYIVVTENRLSKAELAKLQGVTHATIINSVNKFDEYYNYYKMYSDMIDYVISEWASIKDTVIFKPDFLEKRFNKLEFIETIDSVFYCYPTRSFTFKKIRWIKAVECDHNGVFRIEYNSLMSYETANTKNPEGVVELYPAGIKKIEYSYE